MDRARVILIASGVLLLLSLGAIGLSDELHRRIPLFLTLYGIAFAAYALAVWAVLRGGATGTVAIVVIAIASRVMLIPVAPELSTDIHRYLWEGRVVLQGGNPFALAPADSSLLALRDEGFEHINHRHMATIYPPLAQGAFALAAWVQPRLWTLKALFVLFDLATLLLLLRLLRARGRPSAHAIVYAWSPLVIVETAHSGHLDAMGVCLLVLGVYGLSVQRPRVAGVAFAGALLVKYLAAVFVPFLFARRRWFALSALAALVVVGYLPFAGAGGHLLDSLRAYGGRWWFNGPPYMALAGILGDPAMSRRLLLAAGIVFALVASIRERDPARYGFLVVGCALLLSPTVYPWYLVWIIPFLCLFPNRAWILFSGLVALSYQVWTVYDRSGAWIVPTRFLALEYLPFYGLLAWDAARGNVATKGVRA
jgi:hypothetical protein